MTKTTTCANSHTTSTDPNICDGCGHDFAAADRQVAAERAAQVGQHVTKWSHIEIPEGAVLVRRDSLRKGDVVISSHYGRATVESAVTYGGGVHGGTVELRFEGGTDRFIRNERYDADMTMPLVSRPTYSEVAVRTTLVGNSIPAHDETFAIAEHIGRNLDAFRAYVASVRDEAQADAAVAELLAALSKGVRA